MPARFATCFWHSKAAVNESMPLMCFSSFFVDGSELPHAEAASATVVITIGSSFFMLLAFRRGIAKF